MRGIPRNGRNQRQNAETNHKFGSQGSWAGTVSGEEGRWDQIQGEDKEAHIAVREGSLDQAHSILTSQTERNPRYNSNVKYENMKTRRLLDL
jgi:hypothetical protein